MTMRRGHRLAILTFLLTLLPASRAAAQTGIPGNSRSVISQNRAEYFATVLDAINGVVDDWQRAWGEDDVDRLVGLYTPDAVVVTADGRVLRGTDSISDFFARHLEEVGGVRATTVDFDASGEMAVVYARMRPQSGSARSVMEGGAGALLTVYVQEGVGWRIRSQSFHSRSAVDLQGAA